MAPSLPNRKAIDLALDRASRFAQRRTSKGNGDKAIAI
jgi:hypothetical protein